MDFDDISLQFVAQHLNDDTTRLLLSAHRYAEVDMPWAVEQIEARRRLRYKLPEWYAQPQLVMCGRVPAEQCSSEVTARFKASLLPADAQSLCDMTGGMGVDFWYMSRGMRRAIYTERQPLLCQVAQHNFRLLQQAEQRPAAASVPEVVVRQGEATALPVPDVDVIYLDPARRDADGGRVYEISDCEPDVVAWQDELLRHCRCLMVKLSPMCDISRTLRRLHHVSDVYVVGVHGECKELLLVMRSDARAVQCHCVDFLPSGVVRYDFGWHEALSLGPCPVVGPDQPYAWVYEPDVTVMKTMAFSDLAHRFGAVQLDADSHLFVSADRVSDFPGRAFCLDEELPFASRLVRGLKKQIPQANIATRNFPLSPEQLRQRTGIRDGGEVFLFGTTRHEVGPVLLRCHKAMMLVGILWSLVAGWLLPCQGDLQARPRRGAATPSVEQLLSGLAEVPPTAWEHGMPFVFLNPALDVTLLPEVPLPEADTVAMQGQIWHFDALVSEEDWMGQQLLQLRFVSPAGRAYRFSTGRLWSDVSKRPYYPVIPSLYPQRLIAQADSLLRARTLYLLVNDDRVRYLSDSVPGQSHRKFVPVVVDSVTMGQERAPLAVWFHNGEGQTGVVTSCLPSVRQGEATTPLHRVFATTDPRTQHSEVLPEVWALIQQSRLQVGMTADEVRLSWGRPLRVERNATRHGMAELWFYNNNRVLQILDNHLERVGLL